MSTNKIPGVYVSEVSSLPETIAASGGIPVLFVGYTETGGVSYDPVLVKNMFEYEQHFGGPCGYVTVNVDSFGNFDPETDVDLLAHSYKYVMYFSVRNHFLNGGGPCYILSIRNYHPRTKTTNFITQGDYYAVIPETYHFTEPTVACCPDSIHTGHGSGDNIKQGEHYNINKELHKYVIVAGNSIMVQDLHPIKVAGHLTLTSEVRHSGNRRNLWDMDLYSMYFPQVIIPDQVVVSPENVLFSDPGLDPDWNGVTLQEMLDDMETNPSSVYQGIVTKTYIQSIYDSFASQEITLQSCVYAATTINKLTREIGPWAPPANVPLANIKRLDQKLSKDFIENDLFLHNYGRLVNIIRKRTDGQHVCWGTYNWNANDRDFGTIQGKLMELWLDYNIGRALEQVVFEPNTAATWQRVKTLIESFMSQVYRNGGLAGAKADEAFFVRCGLDETMDAQDILDGVLKIEVGYAPKYAAQFVQLNFLHKLQGVS